MCNFGTATYALYCNKTLNEIGKEYKYHLNTPVIVLLGGGMFVNYIPLFAWGNSDIHTQGVYILCYHVIHMDGETVQPCFYLQQVPPCLAMAN